MHVITMSKHTRLRTEQQFDTWPSPEVYNRQGSCQVGFTKPDKPVVNPLVGGYRKPSSYSCPQYLFSDYVARNRVPIVYELDGEGEQPVGSNSMRWKFEGTSQLGLAPSYDHPNINNVRMKLLNNVRAEVLDVAMVLAEISGTANTLSTNLLRLARSMDAVKRRKPESFAFLLTGRRRDNRRPTDKFLRETAGTYLEWKYGIMPTVYDIEGACKGLDMSADGSLFDNPPLLVARARDLNIRSVTQQVDIVEAAGGSARASLDYTTRSEIKARCDYRVSGEGLRGLNRYGIGLGSVATVLFDKTPFSFVLNMALPIAELIKAWTALAGVDVVGYCETHYQQTEVKPQSTVTRIRGIDTVVKIHEQKVTSWRRDAFPRVPMPMPYLRNPVKVGNLSTVLALFTQMRKPS